MAVAKHTSRAPLDVLHDFYRFGDVVLGSAGVGPRSLYSQTLYNDTGATLDDLGEAVTTLEETARIARRVLGGAHPLTEVMQEELRRSRAALRARETPDA